MSDSEIRDAERAYRASGAPQDGEAYVQAVLRSTGLNSTFLIARVIENTRVIAALVSGYRPAVSRPVTPDDMVSFLRGGHEWDTTGPEPVQVVTSYTPESIDVMPGGSLSMRGRGTVRELPAIYPAQVDPNAHLPRTRGVPAGSAILCNHANENPGHCPCEPDCYCRQLGRTCSDVNAVDGHPGECRLCDRDATWYFKTGPRLYVCSLHLAECRMNRQTAANNSLSEMVRHHEAVDDV